MDIEKAKTFLDQCVRHELRDHAFGDREITWTKDGSLVAEGYSGPKFMEVYILDGPSFKGDETIILLGCGSDGEIDRNDSTGPDEFVSGRIMSGLTTEAVLQELTQLGFFDMTTKVDKLV